MRGGKTVGNRCACGNEQNTHFWAHLHLRRLVGQSFMGVMGSGRDDTELSPTAWMCISPLLVQFSAKSDSLSMHVQMYVSSDG